jgi:hypothetical protein
MQMKTWHPLNWLPALLVAAALIPHRLAHAETRVLPFQGRLTDANGNAIADGARVVQFKIYDAPVGGRAVWSGEVQNLSVNAGLVNTVLGTKASLAGVDFNLDLHLEVTVDANGDGQITLADPPLLPRQSILPAVFAIESANSRLLDGYDWSALFGTNNPADGTLLNSKIADGSLSTAKIQDGAVTTAKIPNSAITRPKIDTTGALAGQSLMFNGSQTVWGQVNAVNADFATSAGSATTATTAGNASLLNGFGWSPLFGNGNPTTGTINVNGANVRGDLFLGNGGADYRKMALGGGNSTGYFYGSYPRFGDGIHLSYNYFADAGGGDHVVAFDGSTSRLTVGYGHVTVATAGVGLAPVTSRLRVTTSQVIVENASFVNGSDRNSKQDFASVNSSEILDKVVRLPISEWSYKADPDTRHIGPMAQDFHATFGVGFDDKHIAPIDEGGIALVSIQALHEKVEQKDLRLQQMLQQQQTQIEALKAEIATLKAGQR